MKTEEKTVFEVMTNTDLTEGRGREYVQYVCETITTAKRLAKGNYVQGSNSPVHEGKAYLIDGYWYARAHIIAPTKEDEKEDALNNKKLALIQKMKDAGLTKEDLDFIRDMSNTITLDD